MSTRVQKGNTVFRPVTKTRARLGSEARQSSAAPDARHSSSSVNNAGTMLPPSAVPRRPSSQLSSTDDLSSDSAQFPADNAPTVSHAPNTTTATPIASPITVPTRHSARPPAIQSFTSSRASTPVPPRIQSGSQARAPISIPTPISTPSRPVPTPIATPSRPVPPPQATVITQPPQSAAKPTTPSVPTQSSSTLQVPVNPPAQVGVPISDAQIDPALLQAITTVLQHANQPEGQMPQPEGTSSSAQAVPQEATPQATPATRSRRRARSKKNAENGDSTAASSSSTPRPRRATRRSSNTEATSEGEQSGEETEQISRPIRRRKRASTDSSTPRKRRSRAPSVPPYDPDADPGEELDPTAVTMAELCDDNGRGRVSSKAAQIVTNHAAWRAANREKRARMRAMMEAKKYGRGAEDETAATTEDAATAGPSTNGASESQPAAEPSSSRAPSTGAEQTEGQQGDDFDYTQAVSTSRYNVQVRIGPNGETMIDETSLYVDRQEEEETTNYTHVEESDTTKFVNSMSYSKKLRGSRWSAEETELFFDALSQFGENYELISYVLPGRDRKACKNKFKIEDKRNPNRITFSLKNRRPYDMQTLARMTGKDFSGPPPEIVAPTLPTAPQNAEPQTEDVDEPASSVKVRKQSTTPGLGPGEGEEVVEIIENYEE